MACGDLRSRQRQLGGRASRVCGLFNRALLEGAHDLSYNHDVLYFWQLKERKERKDVFMGEFFEREGLCAHGAACVVVHLTPCNFSVVDPIKTPKHSSAAKIVF